MRYSVVLTELGFGLEALIVEIKNNHRRRNKSENCWQRSTTFETPTAKFFFQCAEI